MAHVLTCPVCTGQLEVIESAGVRARVFGCSAGHRFDVARHGFLTLLNGSARGLTSDSAEMVAARSRILGAVGVLERLPAAVAQTVWSGRTDAARLVVDVGSGTGQYCAAALDASPAIPADGIGIDLSKFCARATARAHPRLAGVVADAWQRLPVTDAAADAVLSVFSPRNFEEFRRILASAGRIVVVSPEPDHLRELIAPMGMLAVGSDKQAALRTAAVAAGLCVVSSDRLTYATAADACAVADLVGMGPSAFHVGAEEIARRAAAVTEDSGRTQVTVAVRITVLCHAETPAGGIS